MNHDTNREDRAAPFSTIGEYADFMHRLIASAFAITPRMQGKVTCLSCGAHAASAHELPCGH